MQRWLIRSCTLIALCASMSTQAQDGPVTAKEIQDTWVGKELTGTIPSSGAPVQVRLDADGKAYMHAGRTNDTGTWRLSENGYCTTWVRTRPGQERCFTVVRAGTTFNVLNPDGSLSGQFTGIR
ncbi:MAG: hypothetical protein KA795_08555 [Burkholderiaceae bacterium]|nr:hypothetical protein [Burkholderiaceae bacterium]